MSEKVVLKTKAEADLEEKRALSQSFDKVTTTERTDYEACLVRFRAVCIRVRELTGIQDFRGGYDEWRVLAMDEQWVDNHDLHLLSRQCDAINLETNYEAGKLGIMSPKWWYECWADELFIDTTGQFQ